MENGFNPLVDAPPTEATTKSGRIYSLESDFRQVIKYLKLLEDPDLDERQKTLVALRVFFGPEIFREDARELGDYLTWYINRGRKPRKDRGPQVFDLLTDSGRVFAAFLQVYRINLRSARMHWWTFCDLLEGLPRGTHLSDVIDIRSRPLPDGKTKESASARQTLIELKARYRIGSRQTNPIKDMFEFLRGIASR